MVNVTGKIEISGSRPEAAFILPRIADTPNEELQVK